jgi:D-glycero-D-manno-heptose 1,7-bisphosphate phosphatase
MTNRYPILPLGKPIATGTMGGDKPGEMIYTLDGFVERFQLIACDVDGTLVRPKSGGEFRKTADDWEWIPGRGQTLIELRMRGLATVFVTNQGGVGFGYFTEREIERQLLRMRNDVEADAWFVCFAHPSATISQYRLGLERRKPSGAMIVEAMNCYGVDAAHTIMVGDRPEDEGAAKDAGCAFQWADIFFEDMIKVLKIQL